MVEYGANLFIPFQLDRTSSSLSLQMTDSLFHRGSPSPLPAAAACGEMELSHSPVALFLVSRVSITLGIFKTLLVYHTIGPMGS